MPNNLLQRLKELRSKLPNEFSFEADELHEQYGAEVCKAVPKLIKIIELQRDALSKAKTEAFVNQVPTIFNPLEKVIKKTSKLLGESDG